MQPTPITVAYGDGIGPEIMDATLRILEAAGAQLAIERIDIGESVYHRGFTSGIEPSAWESLRRTKVFLKAPITTPQGGGPSQVNVPLALHDSTLFMRDIPLLRVAKLDWPQQ